MSLVAGTRDGRKVYANVVVVVSVNPARTSAAKSMTAVRRSRLDAAERNNFESVGEREGRKKLCSSFLGQPGGIFAVKDRVWARREGIFDSTKAASLLKSWWRISAAGQVDGRRAENKRQQQRKREDSCFEGGSMGR